jgi:hypothetical protein
MFGMFKRSAPAPAGVNPKVASFLAAADRFVKQSVGNNASIFNVLGSSDATMATVLAIAHGVSPEAFAAMVVLRNKQYSLTEVVEQFIGNPAKQAA